MITFCLLLGISRPFEGISWGKTAHWLGPMGLISLPSTAYLKAHEIYHKAVISFYLMGGTLSNNGERMCGQRSWWFMNCACWWSETPMNPLCCVNWTDLLEIAGISGPNTGCWKTGSMNPIPWGLTINTPVYLMPFPHEWQALEGTHSQLSLVISPPVLTVHIVSC